jgi:ribonuclease J
MTPGNIDTQGNSSLDWEITSLPVDHSVLGACATIIETKNGTIGYTGDLRFSGSRHVDTERFIQEAKRCGVSILISEGTQTTRENQSMTTEEDCSKNCGEIVAGAEGRFIIADFSPRNVERLVSFLTIAQDVERRLVILPKDVYLLHCLQTVEENIPLPSDAMLVFDVPKGRERKWESWVYDTYGDYIVTASQIHSAPDEYVLAFSFFDIKYLNDIKPSEGLYVYSSSEPYTEEQAIDFQRLHNWLSFYNIETVGFRYEELDEANAFKIHPDHGCHCSGHATPDELEDMVRKIEPEILVPVHTQNSKWFIDKFGDICKVITP